MSSKLELDVCCRLQVAPSGERYGGNRRPGQIDMIYDKIIQILSYAAGYCIPSYKKNFLKHWWDNELDDFKSRSVASCRVGRPLDDQDRGQFLHNIGKTSPPTDRVFVSANCYKQNSIRTIFMTP